VNTKELHEVFDDVLAPLGFRRRKETWYKTNPDTISVINLQKSQWGGQYYVNLAVYLRDLGNSTLPQESQSHIRVRLTAIVGSDAVSVEEALDLEREGLSAERRKELVTEALQAIAVPFLASRSDLPSLRELHARRGLGPVLITKGARELLDTAPKRP